MTLDEIKKLSEDELKKHIADWKKELMKLKVSAMMQKKADKPHMFKVLKKRIARAHTVRSIVSSCGGKLNDCIEREKILYTGKVTCGKDGQDCCCNCN